MSDDTERANILLLDRQQLRCAALACLLSDWAGRCRLDITAQTDITWLARQHPAPGFKLVIFCTSHPFSVTSGRLNEQFEAARAHTPEARHVLITDRADNEAVMAGIAAQVHGFIPTSTKPELAVEALGFILHGGTFFPPAAILQQDANQQIPGGDPLLMLRHRARPNPPCEDHACGSVRSTAQRNGSCRPGDGQLTARQQEVLELLSKGEPNKVIARALDMTEATVKVHVRQIMLKLGVTNRTQVAIRVMQDNLTAVQKAYSAPAPVSPSAGKEGAFRTPHPRLAHLKS